MLAMARKDLEPFVIVLQQDTEDTGARKLRPSLHSSAENVPPSRSSKTHGMEEIYVRDCRRFCT